VAGIPVSSYGGVEKEYPKGGASMFGSLFSQMLDIPGVVCVMHQSSVDRDVIVLVFRDRNTVEHALLTPEYCNAVDRLFDIHAGHPVGFVPCPFDVLECKDFPLYGRLECWLKVSGDTVRVSCRLGDNNVFYEAPALNIAGQAETLGGVVRKVCEAIK